MNTGKLSIPDIYYGRSAFRELEKIIDSRILVVTDLPMIRNTGNITLIENILSEKDDSNLLLISIEKEPVLSDVFSYKAAVMDFQPETVIAFGGGAVIDTAKVFRLFHDDHTVSEENLFQPFFYRKKSDAELIAMPTTSGTGSECTRAAVLIDDQTGKKRLILSDSIVPDIALLCPQATVSMPERVTAYSGFDALVHAVESYTAKNADSMTRMISREAFRLIFTNLRTACRDPEALVVRAALQQGACLAGIGISCASPGISHSLDHFGPKYGVPHGEILSALFLPVLEFNRLAAEPLYAELADAAGIAGGSVSMQTDLLFQKIAALLEECGLPASLKAAGITQTQFDGFKKECAQEADGAFATLQNPKEAGIEDLQMVLDHAYTG